MSDLVAFLRARFDEDEARQIPKAAGSSWGWHTSGCGFVMIGSVAADHCACGVAARVLAEVAAKRARLTFLAETAARCPKDDWPAEGGMEQAPMADMARYLLRMEAQPYADHPDFDTAWRLTPA